MANFFDEFQAIQVAYDSNALNLLKSPYSQTYIALFRSAFPDKTESRNEDDLINLIDDMISDLTAAGMEDRLPVTDGRLYSARELCRTLTDRFHWLESLIEEDGRTTYRLTTDAMRAMDAIDSLSRTDAIFSGSLMRVLREALTRAAAALSSDKRQRRALLKERVKRAQDELKAFDASGGRYTMSREQAQSEVRMLIGLMHDIPADLAKTAQSIRVQTRATTAAFMEDERPIGQIMGEYLQKSREMFTQTEEGRSFLDAVSVISDPSQSNEIADLLDAIANAEAFRGVEWQQRRRLSDAWNQVSQGIDRVLEAKMRATNVISRAVTQFDNTDQRALSKTLKELDHLAHLWAAQVPQQAECTIDKSVLTVDIRTLITREANITPPRPAPPLIIHENDGFEVDMERLVREGGPQTLRLLQRMQADPKRAEDGRVNLSATFNALPARERRSSEVVGILQSLTEALPSEGRTLWRCVDTDDVALVWEGARLLLTDEQLNTLIEEIAHG
ncbi:MAG: DUF3375 family protein [Coriobacteriales bacterium]|nr:DUF3375 family protein [Coriobacteriales bacterium]